MSGDNVNDGLEAEERDDAGMEAPRRFSSRQWLNFEPPYRLTCA